MKKLFKLTIFLFFISIILQSCTVNKYLSISDGSKADGTLTMFYEARAIDRPIIHWEEAKKEAVSKCKNWGYSSAEFFLGSGVKECISFLSDGGCAKYRYTYKCQCIK